MEEETKSRRKRKGICYQLPDSREHVTPIRFESCLSARERETGWQTQGARSLVHPAKGSSTRDGDVPFLTMPRLFRSSPRTNTA